ncbi:MAG TPA: helix-hairpin-helix domain-containing protein, partial [Pseudomonadales bacterium]|nr:helix-hairpin-helix domain-containing protein [Pseudomonadales bacterium]
EAVRRGARREAVDNYQRALTHAVRMTPVEQGRILMALAEQSFLLNLMEEAAATLRRAAALFESANEPALQATALARLAMPLVRMLKNAEADAVSHQALMLARSMAPTAALAEALAVLEDLQIQGLTVVAVAKGSTRKPGLETLIVGSERRELVLAPDSSALHLIQRVRDEAHRFAIGALQKRRAKKSTASALEQIPGVGPKRRRELLRHFGGIRGIENASLEELMRVPGIDRRIAEDVYGAFHKQ